MFLVFFDEYAYWCAQKGLSPTKVAVLNGISEATPSHWKNRGLSPRIEIQIKLANFFEISVEQLNDHTYTPPSEQSAKFALFSGETEVTDEMWEEVKRFAAYVEQRERDKRDN